MKMVNEHYHATERPMTMEEVQAELTLLQPDMGVWILLKKEGGGIADLYSGRLVRIGESALHVKHHEDSGWHSNKIPFSDIHCLVAMTEERVRNLKEAAKSVDFELE